MASDTDVFTPGDLVISVYGDGDGSGTYADNQASPITLEQIDPTTGAVVPITGVANGTLVNGTLVLPQTNSTNAAGTVEYAVSGEYGSSSEGSLQLSADGHSLTIAGYAVNADTYNAGETNGNNVYGNAALAQSTSVPGGTYTPVRRAIADIDASGAVDSSTAVYNVFNTNNPRSVVTTDGRSFYIAGQGVKGDTTQGLFYVQDGASTATAINTTTDLRTAEISNGTLYTSTDSKQGSGGTDNISSYGGEPTSSTPPTILAGINKSVTLTAAQENGVNDASVGKSVNISPENYFFANASTLYVADSGLPKQGGVGDGGLQKWSLTNGTWKLDYTVSQGLNLVNGTSATQGTTGLIGLTGQVVGNAVKLYATNATIGDTDPTFLYGLTDQLGATTAPSGEAFTQLVAAAPDTNIRGVAFAPTAVVCFCSGTLIRTARGDVAVEDLVVGDLAVTASGAYRPIRWIGSRTLDPRRHPEPRHAQPVRIAAHAFAENRPARGLRVSPGHSICVDLLGEVLNPAGALVNGVTVVQEAVETVTYWHVELDGHDILLAENPPAESYIDCGNRGFFAASTGGDAVVELAAGPDAPATTAGYCRPFHADGAFVAVARAQLRRRLPALGWCLEQREPWDGVALVVDGRIVLPKTRGMTACFELSAAMRDGASDIRLLCPTSRPCDTGDGLDDRDLGLCLAAVTFDDGIGAPRVVGLDDPRLDEGFHGFEGTHRWTAGQARLPAALFAGHEGTAFLRMELAAPPVPRWVAPEVAPGAATADGEDGSKLLRLVG